MTISGELAPHPRRVVVGLSLGHGGMSVLINLIAILLVYFYLPPASAGLPALVTDATFFFVLNAIVMVAAAGRLLDAITDPLIAVGSDRSNHRLGRRIPFMRIGAIPAALATILLFVPPVGEVSGWNIAWLLGIQAVLYVALTAYVTPAFSLVADLGRTPSERLDLATWTSVAWAVGIMVAALTPFISAMYQRLGFTPIRAWQGSVITVVGVALACMWAPIRMIDEPSLVRSAPSSVPVRQAVRSGDQQPLLPVLPCRRLRLLLRAHDHPDRPPLLRDGAARTRRDHHRSPAAPHGGRSPCSCIRSSTVRPSGAVGSAWWLSPSCLSAIDFVGVVFLGRSPLPNWLEAVALILLFAVPFAILSVIPQWILSDIAEHAAVTTGQATAATFFAARTFMQKLGQTIGVMMFALLAAFGRDVGDDLGIRLSGFAGMVLYLVAGLLFRRYDEARMQGELATAVSAREVVI